MSENEANPAVPSSVKALIQGTVVSVLPALVVYFSLRAFQISEIHALTAAIVVSAAQAAIRAAWSRKLDPVSVLVILLLGLSLITAIATNNPRATLLAGTVPGFLLTLAFLATTVIRKPLTGLVSAQVQSNLAEAALTSRGWTEQDVRDWSVMHMRLSLGCGLLGVLQAIVALAIIFAFSVDAAQLLNTVIGTGTTILMLVYAVGRVRAFVASRDGAQGHEAASSL